MTSTETCSACACAIPDSTMHFVYQNEDDDDLRLCGSCEQVNLKNEEWIEQWRMIEVWKLGTSVDVSDETEFGVLYVPNINDSAFACEDEVFTYSPICVEIKEEEEDSDDDEDTQKSCVGCGSEKIKYTEMGGEKAVNMCASCFGSDDDEEEDNSWQCYGCRKYKMMTETQIICKYGFAYCGGCAPPVDKYFACEDDDEDDVFLEMDRDERKCQIQDWQKQLIKLARDAGIPEEIYNMGATSDVDELYDLIWGKEDPTHKLRND